MRNRLYDHISYVVDLFFIVQTDPKPYQPGLMRALHEGTYPTYSRYLGRRARARYLDS